ncbi:FAST kinase domain-containing protein 5 [Camponotus floridanus]|uniref:FAST kinase domain-containing protein 5 n=2 Tax=Camponotus floridanus TaxID=104421 RepID=E2ART2_CAMFO|nr:FAST kinase domain-containing protein 5 [Camponotus floridanus]
MSVLTQRLNRLRCTYSVLLRLYDKGSYVQQMIASSERGFSNHLTCTSYIYHVARKPHQRREFAVLSTDQQVDRQRTPNGSEKPKSQKKTENEYAHSFFLNSVNYSMTVMKPIRTYSHVTNEEALGLLKQNWSLMTSEEILSAIKKLSYNICCNKDDCISPIKYINAFNTLDIEKLNDNDLMAIMRYLVPFQSFLNHGFYNSFCERLDKECVKRFVQLNINEMLLLCDVMYQIMRYKKSEYIWYCMRKLGNKPQKLTSKQLVQVLFFLNLCRKTPINMYELEYQLERCINELSINELAIAALGFFKTGTRIRNIIFLEEIMKKTIAELDAIDSVSIGGITKLIRYSMQLQTIPTFQKLLKLLPQYVPRFTLMSLIHIVHAAAKVALYDEDLINEIIKRFNNEIETARLKDIERLIFSLSTFNIDPNNSIYSNVIEELRATWDTSRAHEISEHPQVASCILGYLAILNIYPTDLIERVMAPSYLHKICKGNYIELSREYSVLDYSLRLEVPEYNGPFLKSSLCSFLDKKYFKEYSHGPESSRRKRLSTDVLQTCQELFNTTSDISVIRLLPHYATPDIVFCLDEQNQLVPSEKYLSQFPSSDIIHVNEKAPENVRWIALVMAPHGLLIRNNNLPTGLLAAKLRQLPIIGYTPIMISYILWEKCTSPQEKCDYIKELVFRTNEKLSNK